MEILNIKLGFNAFLLTLLSISLLGCNESEIQGNNISADDFLKNVQNQNSQVHCNLLPVFDIADIGVLMEFANDFSEINCYPNNPISSKITQPKLLGECLLWTVEGIRQNVKFPSLEPQLINTETNQRLSTLQLTMVYNIYSDWWRVYKNNPSPELLNIDLLDSTSFRWN